MPLTGWQAGELYGQCWHGIVAHTCSVMRIECATCYRNTGNLTVLIVHLKALNCMAVVFRYMLRNRPV